MSSIVEKISTLWIRQKIISLWIVIGEVRIKLVEILLKLSFKINKSEEENQIHIDILWEISFENNKPKHTRRESQVYYDRKPRLDGILA